MPDDSALTADLTPEQRSELDRLQYVRVDHDLVWIETDGSVHREPAAHLYYIQTARGIFRVSRIHGRVVEV